MSQDNPPPPPGNSPDRAEVLAWMAKEGAGYKRAAKAWGLPENRVKGWTHAARVAGKKAAILGNGKKGAKDAPASPSPNPVPLSRGQSAQPLPPPKKRGVVDVEALAPEVRQRLRRNAWGLAEFLSGVADVQEARREAAAERESLRAAGVTGKELDARCPMPSIDMRQVESAARALKTTLEIAPGLAAFEAETNPKADTTPVDPSTPEGEAALIASLRLLPPHILAMARAPALEVIDGGKEVGGG